MTTDYRPTVAGRNLVWDVPVRFAHLLLGGSFVAAFAIANLEDDDGPLFSLHMVFGLLMLAAALFRIVWGVVGTRYARFASFEWSPKALVAYFARVVTGRGSPHVGHNPATSYATAAVLLLTLGLAASGLGMTMGIGEELEEVHELLAFALLGVVLLHVAGVLLHLFRHRDDLVLSMVDGKKAIASVAETASPAWAAGAALLVLAVGTLGLGLAGYDPASGSVVVPGIGWRLGESDGRGRELGESRHKENDHDSDDDGREHGAHERNIRHHDN